MDGINWGGLAPRVNVFDQLSEGLMRGTEMRQQRERANLFAQKQAFEMEEAKRARAKEDRELATDNENRLERGIIGHMAAKDPKAAAAKAVEVGQFDLAKELSALNESQRKVARENAEDLGGFAVALKNVPYDQRKAVIAQAQDTLIGYGFTPDKIAAFDPTDEALDAQAAGAFDLKSALEEANRKRDDARAAAKDDEMSQYREDMLALAGRRVGVSERREGRVASGRGGGRGGGAPAKLPSGFILD